MARPLVKSVRDFPSVRQGRDFEHLGGWGEICNLSAGPRGVNVSGTLFECSKDLTIGLKAATEYVWASSQIAASAKSSGARCYPRYLHPAVLASGRSFLWNCPPHQTFRCATVLFYGAGFTDGRRTPQPLARTPGASPGAPRWPPRSWLPPGRPEARSSVPGTQLRRYWQPQLTGRYPWEEGSATGEVGGAGARCAYIRRCENASCGRK
jgi:hypothetical protein